MKSKPNATPQVNEAHSPPLLGEAVALCRADAKFTSALCEIYTRADLAVAKRSPDCRACGACCRFDRMGHRLYVSTGELAMLCETPPSQPFRPGRCPYQSGSQCTARRRRPLGCRVFFCGEGPAEWSSELYEKYHAQIRRLHESHGLPYSYVELTAGLREIL